jgi:hypothetical protein
MSWCLLECLIGLFGFAFIVLFLLWLMFDAIGKRTKVKMILLKFAQYFFSDGCASTSASDAVRRRCQKIAQTLICSHSNIHLPYYKAEGFSPARFRIYALIRDGVQLLNVFLLFFFAGICSRCVRRQSSLILVGTLD